MRPAMTGWRPVSRRELLIVRALSAGAAHQVAAVLLGSAVNDEPGTGKLRRRPVAAPGSRWRAAGLRGRVHALADAEEFSAGTPWPPWWPAQATALTAILDEL